MIADRGSLLWKNGVLSSRRSLASKDFARGDEEADEFC
jgi:hypothetical protein